MSEIASQGSALASHSGAQQGNPTGASQRQAWIRDHVHDQGSISVDQVVAALGVSKMTVHRDLDALEASGVLRKVRGGATALRSSLFESDLHFRLTTAHDAKVAIGREAAKFIEPGQVVMCDESTTALTALQEIDPKEALTVITNCVRTITFVRESTKFRLLGLGGTYASNYEAFLGHLCELMISNIYCDVLLASCSAMNGVSTYHQDPLVVGVKRAMLQSAPTRLLLVDSSKFGNGAIYRMGSVREFTHLITDDQTPEDALTEIRDAGVEVIVAQTRRSTASESDSHV